MKNKTIDCNEVEMERYRGILERYRDERIIEDVIICGDYFNEVKRLRDGSCKLVIMDQPYNRTKDYGNLRFRGRRADEYRDWFREVLRLVRDKISNDGSIYICSDWQTSNIIYSVIEEFFYIRNRITWKRDKGRGCKDNWKNNMEDIWYCVKDRNNFVFNINDVKVRKKVIAPYRDKITGKARDWDVDESGDKYRYTYPSNIWTDLVVPFWSMAENTVHPTQKPEKLIERIILASSNAGDLIFDGFMGSGTTAVVAKRLGRRFICIEKELKYCCIALKRLEREGYL